MLGNFHVRTDLALEARESFEEDDVKIRGVRVETREDEGDPDHAGENRDGKRGPDHGKARGHLYHDGGPEYVRSG